MLLDKGSRFDSRFESKEKLMTTLSVPIRAPLAPTLIASRWHTALLAALFLGFALSGALFQHHAHIEPGALQQHPNTVPLYLSLIVMEWGLVLYVWRGIRRSGTTTLREMIGGRWACPSDVLTDVVIALGCWGIWRLFEFSWNHWLGVGHAASIDTLEPRSVAEGVLWIGVSISAGICEELVFRGYFQRQFTAITRSASLALVLQAALFGIGHGYQGMEACVKIAIFGVGFALLASWRKSLRPGMLAHAWTDIASGLLGF